MTDFHDPPCITLTLTMSEAFVVNDCLNMMAYAVEGNLNTVAMYCEGASTQVAVSDLDRLNNTLREQMEPFVKATAQKMRELAEKYRKEFDDEG